MEDVVVVGAGIVGAAVALNLARRGFRPHVIDRDAPGAGCSFGNAGLIAIDHVAPLANPDTLRALPRMLLQPASPLRLHVRSLPRMAPWLARFAMQSRPARFARNSDALASLVTRSAAAWQRLALHGVMRDLYRDNGAIYVYERPQPAALERRYLAQLDRHQVDYITLSAAQVKDRYLPTLARSISHGRYFPRMAAIAHPWRAVLQLLNAALDEGASFTQAAVSEISLAGGGHARIRLADRTIEARQVVVCAGVRSVELLRPLLRLLGISIPLTRERGYHLQFGQFGSGTLTLPATFVERGFTCNPLEMGIRLAGTVELGGGVAPDWRRADILGRHFTDLFAPREPLQIDSRWFGDRPTLPDYLPVIGGLRGAPNVVLATGHQHLGLTLAPLTGELIAQAIAGEPPAVDLTPFRADRF